MAGKYLGDSFDIHGGGIDLRFPHHENELAQSAAAGRGFARYWLHNAWVTAAGEKMSKSLGNGLAVTEVTRRWSGRAVRLYLVGPHYRSMIEYSSAALDEAAAALARVDSFVRRAVALGLPLPDVRLPERFCAAMDDDLGTPAALAVVYETVREGNRYLEAGDAAAATRALAEVQGMLDVFGLRSDDPVWAEQGGTDWEPLVDDLVSALLEQRTAARTRKDYAAADAIRDRLTALGLTIEDTPQGPRWTK